MQSITIEAETFYVNDENYECSPIFEEVGDKVPTLDGTDHIESSIVKRYIKVTFLSMKRDDHKRLMNVLKKVVSISYFDTKSDQLETRTFILQNNPVFSPDIWGNGSDYYKGFTLEFKEKGATIL
jgi:hypothetical protein